MALAEELGARDLGAAGYRAFVPAEEGDDFSFASTLLVYVPFSPSGDQVSVPLVYVRGAPLGHPYLRPDQ